MSKKNIQQSIQSERGAVSIFVVIFTALLITVITISFVRLMVRDQQQAVSTDLSQSAFDSAQAGVEDAKRALIKWQTACMSDSPDCDQMKAIINSEECNTVARMLYGRSSADMSETKVQQTSSSADAALDQAYTCAVIKTNTDNYQGRLEADESKLVRLRGASDFDRIELSWFMERDRAGGTRASLDNSIALPNSWIDDRPPIMRTQLIRVGDSFSLEDFNRNENSSTLYLYPNRNGLSTGFDFATDGRLNSKRIDRVGCQADLAGDLYHCRAEVTIPGGVRSSDEAFLRLVAHYNDTHFAIKLFQGANLVPFDGVQPAVDSTGRANDLFRRIESRIELTDASFPYPEAAVDIAGDLCKTFRVTDAEGDYSDGGCQP